MCRLFVTWCFCVRDSRSWLSGQTALRAHCGRGQEAEAAAGGADEGCRRGQPGQ